MEPEKESLKGDGRLYRGPLAGSSFVWQRANPAAPSTHVSDAKAPKYLCRNDCKANIHHVHGPSSQYPSSSPEDAAPKNQPASPRKSPPWVLMHISEFQKIQGPVYIPQMVGLLFAGYRQKGPSIYRNRHLHSPQTQLPPTRRMPVCKGFPAGP